jgi:hypothetical protein
LDGRLANLSKGEIMSSIDRLFRFGTWVPEVWQNTIQHKEHQKDFEQAMAEVHSLRNVLVLSDRMIAHVVSGTTISTKDKNQLLSEITKAMSFTLNDEVRPTPRAVDVATGPENDDFCEHGVIRGECLICPPRY